MLRLPALSFVLLAIAQAQTTTPAAFEVISIKPHTSGDPRMGFRGFQPGGRFRASNVVLKGLIAMAYDVGVQSKRLTGGPAWITSPEGVFDIEATAAPGALPNGLPTNVLLERQRQMIQKMLADRFQLKVHSETRELTVYAVVMGKNGPKLEKSKIEEKDCPEPNMEGKVQGCHNFWGGRGRGLHGDAVTVADIAQYVENWTDRPVIDRSGIQGLYKVDTRGWRDLQPGPVPAPGTKAEDGGEAADVPTIFEVFERLGLKLEVQKLPVEIVVIDSVSKPTVN